MLACSSGTAHHQLHSHYHRGLESSMWYWHSQFEHVPDVKHKHTTCKACDAALSQTFLSAVHACRRAGVGPGKKVAILGAGPIGNCCQFSPFLARWVADEARYESPCLWQYAVKLFTTCVTPVLNTEPCTCTWGSCQQLCRAKFSVCLLPVGPLSSSSWFAFGSMYWFWDLCIDVDPDLTFNCWWSSHYI